MARATSSVENSKGESRRSSDAMAKDELSGKKEKDVNYDHAIGDGKITKNSVENEVNLGSKETTHSDQYHEEAKSDDVGAGQSYLSQMEILSTQSEVVGEQSELIGAQSEMAEKYSFVIENMSDFSEEEQEFALLAETKTELELIDTEELESEALNLEQNIKKPTQTGAEFKQKSEEIEKRIVELEEQIANPESEKQVTEVEKQTRRDLPKTDSPRQDFESDTSERSQSIASTSTEKEIRESEPILQEYQNIKLELQLDVDTVAVEASEKIKPSQSQPAVEDEQEQPQVLPATWQEESDEHLESETNELGLKIKFREESRMEPKTSNREFSESKTTVASLDKEIRDKMDSLSVLSIEITETATAQKLESTLDEEEEPVRHVESNETETKPAVTPEQAVKSDQSINEPDLGPEKLKSEDATANELDVVFSQSQISPRPKLSEQQFAETIEDAEIKTISNKFKPTESELFETKVQQEKEELKLDIKVIKPPSSPPIPETEQTTSGTVQFTLEQETSEQTQVKQETKANSKVTETKKETEETTEADGAFTAAEPDLPDSSSLSDEKVAGYSSIEVNEFEELKESSDTSSSSSSKFTIIDVTEEEVVLGEPPSIDDSLLKRVDESLMSLPEKNVMSVSESTSDNNDASFNGASYVDVPAQENADQSQNETIVIQDKTVDTEDDHDKTLNVETSMITPQASEEANEEATRITDIITKKTSDICDAVADEVVTSKPHASSKKVETDETIKKEENISDNPENLLESYVIKQDEETSKSAQTESVEVSHVISAVSQVCCSHVINGNVGTPKGRIFLFFSLLLKFVKCSHIVSNLAWNLRNLFRQTHLSFLFCFQSTPDWCYL